MKCKKVVKLIPEHLDDTLESPVYQEIEKHLESCDSCRKEIPAYQKTIQIASSLPVEYPSKEVWDNFVPELLSKIEESSEKRTPLLKWQFIKQHAWQFAGGAAASIVIIAAIVAVVFNSFLFVPKPQQNEPKTVREVIAANLIINNMPIEQINKAIESIGYSITTDANQMCIDEIIAMSEEESSPDAMDIANVIVTEIDSSELDYDYKLLEAIAYLEEYNTSKGK